MSRARYCRPADWGGHLWRCSTRRGEWSRWRCVNGCGLRALVPSKVLGNQPPTPSHLEHPVRGLTCGEVVAMQVLES